jgi:hypothetical protein
MKKYLCSLLLLSACVTSPKVFHNEELANIPEDKSGLIWFTDLSSTVNAGQKGCLATLTNRYLQNRVTVSVPPGKNILFIELEPGIYTFNDLSCNRIKLDAYIKNANYTLAGRDLVLMSSSKIQLDPGIMHFSKMSREDISAFREQLDKSLSTNNKKRLVAIKYHR